MKKRLSQRLNKIVDALPLRKGIRVLEIGCGTGSAAREIANRIGSGYILAIDRSAKAIKQAIANSNEEIQKGNLVYRQVAVENFELPENEKLFDLAFGIRVGALDGRHPEIEEKTLISIAKTLKTNGKLFIDGGKPLKEISLKKYRRQSG